MTSQGRGSKGPTKVKRARVHYTGRLEDGTVFDSSRDRDPLVVPFGQQRVIKGFEEALQEMEAGETRRVTIPPPKAYGPYREELVTEVPRGRFSDDLELKEGQHLKLSNPGGMVTQVRVKEVGAEKVTLDANHPLAGKTLIFDIEFLELM